MNELEHIIKPGQLIQVFVVYDDSRVARCLFMHSTSSQPTWLTRGLFKSESTAYYANENLTYETW